jgi:hypothetical protein
MAAQADWNAIEGQYRANSTRSIRSIAAEFGVTEGAIRSRAKRLGWVRDPSSTKREIVESAMAGVPIDSRGITQDELRNLVTQEATNDLTDMSAGLSVARQCIGKLSEMVKTADDPREIKIIVEANRGAIETIRKIRGLDREEEKPKDPIDDMTREELEREILAIFDNARVVNGEATEV